MKPYWLAALALVPTIASAQTSTKCADLTNFKIPGATMVITKATVVPASSSSAAATAEDRGVI